MILVTGATGNVGGEVVAQLLEKGARVRVLTRDPTVREQVDSLGRVLGKAVRCVDVPVEQAVQGMMGAGAPARLAAAVGQSFEAVRAGGAATVTDAIERVTGKRPMTFDAWAEKHAARFAS